MAGPRKIRWRLELLQASKRILNQHSRNPLPVAEILGKNPTGAALDRRRHDHRVPKSNSRFVLDSKCSSDFGRGGLNAPDRIALYNQPRGLFGKRLGNLSRDIDIKFLQDLHAENAASLAPESLQDS